MSADQIVVTCIVFGVNFFLRIFLLYLYQKSILLSIPFFSDDFEFFSVDGNGMVSYHFFEKIYYK